MGPPAAAGDESELRGFTGVDVGYVCCSAVLELHKDGLPVTVLLFDDGAQVGFLDTLDKLWLWGLEFKFADYAYVIAVPEGSFPDGHPMGQRVGVGELDFGGEVFEVMAAGVEGVEDLVSGGI